MGTQGVCAKCLDYTTDVLTTGHFIIFVMLNFVRYIFRCEYAKEWLAIMKCVLALPKLLRKTYDNSLSNIEKHHCDLIVIGFFKNSFIGHCNAIDTTCYSNSIFNGVDINRLCKEDVSKAKFHKTVTNIQQYRNIGLCLTFIF